MISSYGWKKPNHFSILRLVNLFSVAAMFAEEIVTISSQALYLGHYVEPDSFTFIRAMKRFRLESGHDKSF